MDFTSVILPQIMLDLGVVVVLELIVMSIIFVEIMAHCICKVVSSSWLMMIYKW